MVPLAGNTELVKSTATNKVNEDLGLILGQNLDVAGFVAFRTGCALERHTLVFAQAFETAGLYVLEVGEQICTTCIRSDKAEALSIVEPFNYTCLSTHVFFLLIKAWAKSPKMDL
jgi:hypothetical protein